MLRFVDLEAISPEGLYEDEVFQDRRTPPKPDPSVITPGPIIEGASVITPGPIKSGPVVPMTNLNPAPEIL